jgi:hypothetical protein
MKITRPQHGDDKPGLGTGTKSGRVNGTPILPMIIQI